jgi:hypothetical protein
MTEPGGRCRPHHRAWAQTRPGQALAVLALLATVAAAAPARGTGAPEPGGFGLTPSPTAAGRPRPYFRFAMRPGRSARDTAIVSNDGPRTLRLRITTVVGVTALNSGSAFEARAGCTGASCWMTGLPVTVTLGPGAHVALPFRVTVPAGTPPGQYLAGLAAEPAARPRPVRLGSHGRASALAVIVDQVDVGVAVTVGSRSRLKTILVIPAVTGGFVGTTPRLYIRVRNSGQTFTKATGTILCLAGGRRRWFRVIMDTVLPGGGAVLPVNAPGLSGRAVPCRVRLHDGAARAVTWSGIVQFPDPAPATTVHTGNGVYSAVPRDQVPPWAIVLMVLGALILATLLALLLRRRSRSRPA